MREVLLVVHIIAAAGWIGGVLAEVMTTRRLVARGGSTAAAWMETVVFWGRAFYTPAAIVILATGVGLVLDSALYGFSSAFVSVGFLAVIVGAGLGMAVFGKGGARASAAFAADDDVAGAAEVARMRPLVLLEGAVLLLAVVAMVYKWGA